MPVTVIVRSAAPPSGDPPSLTFDGGRIAIGRSDGCDVRLPDASVSHRHASIRAQGSEFAIVDEGSTNGTWVGGVKLGPHTPRLVRSGDLVRVGRVWLELVIGQRAPTPDLGLATRELALALVRQAMDKVGDDTRVRIRVTEGPDLGAELGLADDGRAYVIGRSESCDLPLADEDASREHASVTRRGSTVLLRDLRSKNGVFLGETAILPERDVPWRPPTMVRIGLAVLALDEPVSVALAELEGATDEALPEAGVPAAPPSSAVRSAPPAPPPSVPVSRASVPPPAPIAEVGRVGPERRAARPPVRERRRWGFVDILVVGVALAIIALSIAGLVWVLR